MKPSIEERLYQLEETVGSLRQALRQEREAVTALEYEVRIAETKADVDGYPLESETPNVYPIVFTDGDFDDALGAAWMQSGSFPLHAPAGQRKAYSLNSEFLAEGTKVAVLERYGHYFIFPLGAGSTPDPKARAVRVVGPSSPSSLPSCTLIESHSECVWDGEIVEWDIMTDMCGQVLLPQNSIYVFDARQCIPEHPTKNYLPKNEVYYGYKVGTFTRSASTRDLYAIFPQDSRTQVIKITGPGPTTPCEELTAHSECIYEGKIAKLTDGQSDFCDAEFDDTSVDVWVLPLTNCMPSGRKLRYGEIHHGQRLGAFQKAADKRDLYGVWVEDMTFVRLLEPSRISASEVDYCVFSGVTLTSSPEDTDLCPATPNTSGPADCFIAFYNLEKKRDVEPGGIYRAHRIGRHEGYANGLYAQTFPFYFVEYRQVSTRITGLATEDIAPGGTGDISNLTLITGYLDIPLSTTTQEVHLPTQDFEIKDGRRVWAEQIPNGDFWVYNAECKP